MRRRERERWMKLVEDEREAHRLERQELLNRLAQPDRPLVDVRPVEAVEPPHDDAEFAFVGSEVPEGVQVGELGRNA